MQNGNVRLNTTYAPGNNAALCGKKLLFEEEVALSKLQTICRNTGLTILVSSDGSINCSAFGVLPAYYLQ